MTHDELLARLKEKGSYDLALLRYNPVGIKHIQDIFEALRAVVEMHSPVGVVCGWCTCQDCDHIVDYPCKTIRVIEKWLE